MGESWRKREGWNNYRSGQCPFSQGLVRKNGNGSPGLKTVTEGALFQPGQGHRVFKNWANLSDEGGGALTHAVRG